LGGGEAGSIARGPVTDVIRKEKKSNLRKLSKTWGEGEGEKKVARDALKKT